MLFANIPIILASKSPRRKKLLSQIGLKFQVKVFETDESYPSNLKPFQIAKYIAKQKLDEAKKHLRNSIIITADTIVVLDKEILGKPKNEADAVEMLQKLSGKKHYVYTGLGIVNQQNGKEIIDFVKTCVKFRLLNNEEIIGYVSSGSPMDKAGSYGIQDDFGAVFVERISGCFYNVMGLPLSKLVQKFDEIA